MLLIPFRPLLLQQPAIWKKKSWQLRILVFTESTACAQEGLKFCSRLPVTMKQGMLHIRVLMESLFLYAICQMDYLRCHQLLLKLTWKSFTRKQVYTTPHSTIHINQVWCTMALVASTEFKAFWFFSAIQGSSEVFYWNKIAQFALPSL